MRLLGFLRSKCGHLASVKAIKRAIEGGLCTLNGKIERFSTHVLLEDDTIVFDTSHLQDKKEKKSFEIAILYEDKELLVCNKPSGLVSENKAFNAALPSYRGKLQLIHRLDKETTGAILLAKTEEMREKMVALFVEKEVRKFYLALVDKEVKKEEGKIDNFLTKKNSYAGQSIWGEGMRGLRAITLWKCLKRLKGISLLECEPITGRTHQLRVHLSSMGHPILGDYQYGKHFSSSLRPARMLLHAYRLIFSHPKTNKIISITAPIPKDFLSFLPPGSIL